MFAAPSFTLNNSGTSKTKICQVYKGVVKGQGSSKALGVEFNTSNCQVSPTDVTPAAHAMAFDEAVARSVNSNHPLIRFAVGLLAVAIALNLAWRLLQPSAAGATRPAPTADRGHDHLLRLGPDGQPRLAHTSDRSAVCVSPATASEALVHLGSRGPDLASFGWTGHLRGLTAGWSAGAQPAE